MANGIYKMLLIVKERRGSANISVRGAVSQLRALKNNLHRVCSILYLTHFKNTRTVALFVDQMHVLVIN